MAKATDDFEWPPKGDEVSIFEIGPDPWQKLQDASREAFLKQQRERSQPQQTQPPQQTRQPTQRQQAPQPKRVRPRPVRTPEPAPAPARKLTRVLIVSAIVAAAAGWAIQAATTPAVPVQTFHHPAPVTTPTPPPPPITVVATYPVEPAVPVAAPVERVDAPAPPDTTAAPADTAAADSGPATVEPGTTPPGN